VIHKEDEIQGRAENNKIGCHKHERNITKVRSRAFKHDLRQKQTTEVEN
jgi:hypothetical protein